MTYDTVVTNGKQTWHFSSTNLGLAMKKALDFYAILHEKTFLKPYITLHVHGMNTVVYNIVKSKNGGYWYE